MRSGCKDFAWFRPYPTGPASIAIGAQEHPVLFQEKSVPVVEKSAPLTPPPQTLGLWFAKTVIRFQSRRVWVRLPKHAFM